jgi:hypothetical protein
MYVLECQLRACMQYRPADRTILAAFSRLVALDLLARIPGHCQDVAALAPGNAQGRWRRSQEQRRPGHPALPSDVIEVIVRLGKESCSRGCARIQGGSERRLKSRSAGQTPNTARNHASRSTALDGRLGTLQRNGMGWRDRIEPRKGSRLWPFRRCQTTVNRTGRKWRTAWMRTSCS